MKYKHNSLEICYKNESIRFGRAKFTRNSNGKYNIFVTSLGGAATIKNKGPKYVAEYLGLSDVTLYALEKFGWYDVKRHFINKLIKHRKNSIALYNRLINENQIIIKLYGGNSQSKSISLVEIKSDIISATFLDDIESKIKENSSFEESINSFKEEIKLVKKMKKSSQFSLI